MPPRRPTASGEQTALSFAFMSQSQQQRGQPSLGSRENFFASDEEDYEEVPPPSERGPDYGVTKAEWFSKSILLQVGEPVVLCPRCLHEDDVASELSEPVDHIPPSHVSLEGENSRQFYTDHRRHRYCLDWRCGHYAWGGVLQDRPTTEYLRVVEITLDDIYGVVPKRDEYYRNAQSRKARGWNDVKNHRRLIRELEAGDPDL